MFIFNISCLKNDDVLLEITACMYDAVTCLAKCRKRID